MFRKTLILAFSIIFVLTSSLMAVEKLMPSKVSSEEPVMPPLITAGCILSHTNGMIGSYFGGFSAGMINISYFDPATCPATPTYPFEIKTITFPLYNDGTMSYPVQVDVVVYDLVNPPDPCGGPGVELCRETFSCDSTFDYFGVYGMNSLTFSNPCCVNGPFYIGLEYTDAGTPPFPSILFDNQAPDTCVNWFYYGGIWYDWHTIWTPPTPGYPIFWVNGNTPPNNCPDQPFPNHKMHFPQYPDLMGWDVNTTSPVPLKLADDWECTQTGLVTDIHFWGSWKDADGDPWFDDIDPGGVNAFIFEIYSNYPGPPSHPDSLLWTIIEWVPGTPTEPPTMEHWYDPLLVMNWPNDHVPYWQYDFVNIPGPFLQQAGNIYWLAITPILDDPVNYHWGWKTSRDHFMDDAVWWTGEMWESLIEPPRMNRFGVYFNEYGEPIDEGSTNYYGIGWYYYPEYYWWNMWFYDNPYTPDNPKQIFISFDVMPTGMGPASVAFALNWSSQLWSLEGVPDRPPLPWDGNEDLFIGRQTFTIDTVGHFSIPYTLPFNPEWVSIDFIGQNVVIYNGVIEHECVQTSMDMAFVITGEPEEEEPVYDLWETPENYNTYVDFGCGPSTPPVPADFFGPGSDPFDGTVSFSGEPLTTAPPDVLGPTDTIVKRNRPADLPQCPSSDQVEVEIVALNLVSVEPITVTYYGGQDPEDWDVRVCLSEFAPQSPGTMTITQVCTEGGTFTAYIPVSPKIIFTRISDGYELYIDYGAEGIPDIEYFAGNGHWLFSDPGFNVYTSNGTELVSNCDDIPDIAIGPSAVDLIPGLQVTPCENCDDPPMDHTIPITSLIEVNNCAQQDVWPPHPVSEPIPTLSEWGMIILALLLLAAGTVAVVRRRRAVTSKV